MKVFFLLCLLFLSLPSFAQDNTPPKKEVLITITSKYYQNASQVVEGFLKQAKIFNYAIDTKLEKVETKNFKFVNKTIDQTTELLGKLYNITFETNDKKDFYFVSVKEKK